MLGVEKEHLSIAPTTATYVRCYGASTWKIRSDARMFTDVILIIKKEMEESDDASVRC